jgi:hypothetical protein
MANELEEKPASTEASRIAGSFRNIGEPLRFSGVEPIAGFAAEPAKEGEQLKVWTKLALTSDTPLFHRLVENFTNVVNQIAMKAGVVVNLRRADTVLLIFRSDATAELWIDTAAISLKCMVKRAMAAGIVLFERDIADVTGMTFPLVSFGESDKVLCLFRQDWRFGFAFDMNPEGKFDLEGFSTTLGTLYRNLHYKHLYDALSEPAIFDNLLGAGWFPFTEIITAEFKDLLHHCEAGFDVSEIEDKIIAKFDEVRIHHILERWLAKPHFSTKTELLKAAASAFSKKEPISVIKILLTEIEGILNDAYKAANNGQGARINDLLAFAEASAEHKAGANTLLFPKAFSRYMREYTFAKFDPIAQTGTAGSRHAVGHGAAAQDSYTMTRALQVILTLDQLAFYT